MVKSLNHVHLYCLVFCADYLNYFLGLSNRRGNQQLRQQKLLSLKSRLTSWTKYSQEGIGTMEKELKVIGAGLSRTGTLSTRYDVQCTYLLTFLKCTAL